MTAELVASIAAGSGALVGVAAGALGRLWWERRRDERQSAAWRATIAQMPRHERRQIARAAAKKWARTRPR